MQLLHIFCFQRAHWIEINNCTYSCTGKRRTFWQKIPENKYQQFINTEKRKKKETKKKKGKKKEKTKHCKQIQYAH